MRETQSIENKVENAEKRIQPSGRSIMGQY